MSAAALKSILCAAMAAFVGKLMHDEYGPALGVLTVITCYSLLMIAISLSVNLDGARSRK